MKKYKVLFCDLDGTLIETISGNTFPKGVWDMKFKIDVLESIKCLNPYYIFIVTNQGGIEKGFVNEDRFSDKAQYICSAIKEYCGCKISDCVYCKSNNKEDSWRKPNCGMLKIFYGDYANCVEYNKPNLFEEKVNFNKSDCLMIGDASGLPGQFSDSDKKTAENFGIDYMDVNEFINNYK